MDKNTAGKWVVFAYGLPDHASPGVPVTGDAANITANIRIDGGAANAVDDTNPTELEDGYYVFDITAAEANGDLLSIHPASSTADVQVIGVPGALWTRPTDFGDVITNTTNIEADTQDIQSRLPAALVSGKMDSDAVALAGSTEAAGKLQASAESMTNSTAASGSTTTVIQTNLTEATDNHYSGQTMRFTGGALDGQGSRITGYNGTTKAVTVAGFTEAPADTDPFVIV